MNIFNFFSHKLPNWQKILIKWLHIDQEILKISKVHPYYIRRTCIVNLGFWCIYLLVWIELDTIIINIILHSTFLKLWKIEIYKKFYINSIKTTFLFLLCAVEPWLSEAKWPHLSENRNFRIIGKALILRLRRIFICAIWYRCSKLFIINKAI